LKTYFPLGFPEMNGKYTLYGSYASYYTAKTRTYLRKKGIDFVERLPSDPVFRETVRPASGSHRIPQLLTPEGEVLQDSVTILDFLESRFPEIPAFPSSPAQRVFVHLMELMASEGLVQLAWLHRWIFSEQNFTFVKKDFGRSFKPQGTDEELLKYGNLIADRMMSGGLLPEGTDELKNSLDQQYLGLLKLMETHLISHPYFLGGHPSAADYSIMGALHAHLGRDPAGLQLMQANAPRVFRWVEHMIVPEVQSPEFFQRPVKYPENDEVPETSLNILHYIADNFGEKFVLGALAFNQLVERTKPGKGFVFNEEQDQPVLGSEIIYYKGVEHKTSANLHAVWLSQRAQCYYQALGADAKASVMQTIGDGIAAELLSVPVLTTIERVNNRLVVAGALPHSRPVL
jgi:glutathione S-transferase